MIDAETFFSAIGVVIVLVVFLSAASRHIRG